MLLRMLREPETGRPGPAARLVAVLMLAILIGGSAVALFPAARWVIGLL